MCKDAQTEHAGSSSRTVLGPHPNPPQTSTHSRVSLIWQHQATGDAEVTIEGACEMQSVELEGSQNVRERHSDRRILASFFSMALI